VVQQNGTAGDPEGKINCFLAFASPLASEDIPASRRLSARGRGYIHSQDASGGGYNSEKRLHRSLLFVENQ